MVLRAAAWFAETPAPSPSPEAPRYIDPSTVGPGVIGFVLFVFLGIATFLLWRSMNHQLKKIDFDEDQRGDDRDGEHGGDTVADRDAEDPGGTSGTGGTGDRDATGGTPKRSDPTGTGDPDPTNRSETPETVGSDRFGDGGQAGSAGQADPGAK